MKKQYRYIKNMVCIVLCVFAFFCTDYILVNAKDASDGFAAGVNGETVIAESVVYKTDWNLYKGETRVIPVMNVGGESSVSFESSNPLCVKVSNNGTVTALKAGRSIISTIYKKGELSYQSEINVEVSISSFYHTGKYGKSINPVKSNTKLPVLGLHSELKKGAKKQLYVKNCDDVQYKSSDNSIVTVDDKGLLVAKKKGASTITVVCQKDDCKITYKEMIHVLGKTKEPRVSSKKRNRYLSNAGFIGNSVGLGLESYIRSKGKGFLGGPTMMVRGCYSFANDKSRNTPYMIRYRGVPYQAKDAVAKSKIKKVFINMGTNDLGIGYNYCVKSYFDYINGIRKKNPNVIIFIESMTPARSGKGDLNNANINRLNKELKKYAKKHKDVYYIDISTCMKESGGRMKKAYSSDGYVHISMAGYKAWVNALCEQVEVLLAKEQIAKDAVSTATESKDKEQVEEAEKVVSKLDDSTVKTLLNKKLKQIKVKE